MLPRITALAGLAFASWLPACAGQASASSPWPATPSQKAYTEPHGDTLVAPVAVVKGLTDDTSSPLGSSPMVFSSVNETYTLDYGRNVAGKAFFQVDALSDYAQIEVKYTESYVGLEKAQADGPFAFANGLGATFRVETFNITKTGEFRAYFIQGAQRWQSIRLVRGSGLTISKAGFVSSISMQPLDTIKGYFASSNSSYTDMWALGPRTEQLDCYAPGTQSSTWDITSQGAYIRGQKPATTTHVVNLKNYTLTFETMIDFGGTGWRLDTEIDAIQATGPLFVLTSEYPEGSFANIDRSLVPANTLVLGRGWSLQNQTTLPGYVLDKFPINFAITEKTWHTISTVSPGDDTYKVYLDDKEIASFNISSYGVGNANPFIPGGVFKSFALGPWQDQAAYYRNVGVTSNSGDNAVLYSNSLTTADVLTEFGVAANIDYVCSDGGKRDRYAWLGDRVVSARSGMVSTGDWQYFWGPAEQYLSRQTTAGQLPCNTLFSELDPIGALVRTQNVDPLLVDYNFDFVPVIYDYWMRSGNTTFLEKHYDQLVSMMSYSISRALDQPTNLYGAPYGAKGIPLSGQKAQALGPAETISMVLSLERMADISEHMSDTRTALFYRVQANLTRNAIEASLWNQTGGYYTATLGSSGFDMMDAAQVLLAKVGTPEKRSRVIDNLAPLRLPAGYSNGTRYTGTPAVVNPHFSAFLLEGFAKEKRTGLAQDLLDATWTPMIRQDRNYTGTSWEYVSGDGVYPGLDLFTSSSHGWGSYATTFLSDYVLGIRATSPGFATYIFAPLPGFKSEWVHGRVPTPAGEILAAWGYESSGKFSMEVAAPAGLKGTVVVPFDGQYSVDGGSGQEGEVQVEGGKTVKISQL